MYCGDCLVFCLVLRAKVLSLGKSVCAMRRSWPGRTTTALLARHSDTDDWRWLHPSSAQMSPP